MQNIKQATIQLGIPLFIISDPMLQATITTTILCLEHKIFRLAAIKHSLIPLVIYLKILKANDS
jgi:hypothetical protein